ncbi:hypothetical protein Q7O56_29380 [Pseudomonas protegens]|nr:MULTISPECIES: hypothetical protein [Pseudomonas chlororaphis group]MCO7579528.1 hypothetical protein [Pseudomonas protegens]MCO7585297.1 hypothetical protein [Pseudomonas chlororaphis]MDP9513150.1 hypothetical protein [Pseudomonas protegens]
MTAMPKNAVPLTVRCCAVNTAENNDGLENAKALNKETPPKIFRYSGIKYEITEFVPECAMENKGDNRGNGKTFRNEE